MKIDGIKGCFEKTRGMFYFARMCSKIRVHAQGRLAMPTITTCSAKALTGGHAATCACAMRM
jgi:hypothetical protein